VHILVLLAFAILLLWAAGEDVRRLIIPNWISLTIVGLYPLYLVTGPTTPDWMMAAGVAALTLVVGFGLFALNLMGGGDVKLMAAIALWAGPSEFPVLVLVTSLVGGVIAFFMLIQRWISSSRHRGERAKAGVMPYGVAIAAGGLTVALSLAKGG
jgi:prepilin peptidase CpaA